jgi:hypothetical protein
MGKPKSDYTQNHGENGLLPKNRRFRERDCVLRGKSHDYEDRYKQPASTQPSPSCERARQNRMSSVTLNIENSAWVLLVEGQQQQQQMLDTKDQRTKTQEQRNQTEFTNARHESS